MLRALVAEGRRRRVRDKSVAAAEAAWRSCIVAEVEDLGKE